MKNGDVFLNAAGENAPLLRAPTPSAYLCAGCQHGDNFDQICQLFCARGRVVQDRAIISADELCHNCGAGATPQEIDEFIKKDLELRLLRAAVAKAEGAPQESPAVPAVPAVRQKNPAAEKMLLTKRAAVRALGIDRAKFYELIKEGRIAVVEINGRERIARAEIERIMAEGVPAVAPTRRATQKSPRRSSRGPGALAGSQGDAIRALKI